MVLDYLKTINLAIRANKNTPLNRKECGKYTSRQINARDFRSIWLDFGRCTEKTTAIQQALITDNSIGITKVRGVEGFTHFSLVEKLVLRIFQGTKCVYIDEPFMFTDKELDFIYEVFNDEAIFIHLGRPRYVGNQGS